MPQSLDLNLLHTFTVVYRLGSITAAAEALNLSQPAVSHALKRLRQHFDDPLFVRSRSGVRPTHLAATIYEEVGGPITQLATVAEEKTRFDPQSSTRRFRIALTDLGEAALLPRILRVMARSGPGIRVVAERLDITTIGARVASGDVDAAIASSRVQGGIREEILFHDQYGCMVPGSLTEDDGKVRLEDLRRLPEVRVGESAGHKAITDVLARIGPGVFADSPHVEVQGFTSLPKIVGECGYAAIVPINAFRELARADDVKLLRLPFTSPSTAVWLMSQRESKGRETYAQRWFLAAIRDALQVGPNEGVAATQ
ncbi:LysR family transcriptional regulator [Microbacterium sp.]|uniref:LysR family transcriptional regulator n=1 Tax=Microbacterium sp. TaxID=51671 RepID=UPI0037C7682F